MVRYKICINLTPSQFIIRLPVHRAYSRFSIPAIYSCIFHPCCYARAAFSTPANFSRPSETPSPRPSFSSFGPAVDEPLNGNESLEAQSLSVEPKLTCIQCCYSGFSEDAD